MARINKLRILATAFSLVAFIFMSKTVCNAKVLHVPQIFQEQSNWCWAACSQAVLSYYGTNITQCTIANWARINNNWGEDNCCEVPGGSVCNRKNSMYSSSGSILGILDHWGVNSDGHASSLTQNQVTTEINDFRPIIIRWGWSNGGGHFLVIRGIEGNKVYYLDPLPGHGYQIALYSWVLQGGDHTWTHTLQLTSEPPVLTKGLQYLYDHQNSDGSWTIWGGENVGVSALATAAFANHGETSDPQVQKALSWILAQQQPDGSICSNWYPMYDTSLSILALIAAGANQYYDNIRSAVAFLVNNQNNEVNGYDTSYRFYGGWGYSLQQPDESWDGEGWADLSNTQWVLLALHYAENINTSDTIVPQAVWDRALLFLRRCQNRQVSNPAYSFSDDGGFIYQPASTIWNGGQSYGSMTTAGLWGYYVESLSKGSAEVAAAINWLGNNYSVSGNPGMGGPGSWGDESTFLYYYLYGFAKACVLYNITTIAGHDWYSEMADFLAESQAEDGSWDCGDECGPIVNTAFAILALETKQVAQNTGLEITVHSPVDLHVYDAQGRHVGVNYDTGGIDLEIPGATYTGPNSEPQTIYIPNPGAGRYRIKLVATGTGNYSLEVKGIVNGDTSTTYTYAGTVTEGEIVDVLAVVSAIAGPITVDVSTPITDITELLNITHSRRQLYDRIHHCFFILVTIENPGDTLSGPIRLVITDPSIPVKTGVGVGLEPDGYTEDGNPYFLIVPNGEDLGAGEALQRLRVNFELQRKRLTYGIKVEQLTTGIPQPQ